MSRKVIFSWVNSLQSLGATPEAIEAFKEYAKPLIQKKIPIIINNKHLSKLLGRAMGYTVSVVNSNISHYREFKIPKKKVGERILNVPYPALLQCQYWIYHNILKHQRIHGCAHAFAYNKSIITNANYHLNSECLLKIDLKDFFTSISDSKVLYYFKSLGYSNEVAVSLTKFCTYESYLPQGAPTSPVLSNILSARMDNRFYKLVKKFGFKYTRYADDICISGKDVSAKLFEYAKQIISDEGLEINPSKSYIIKGKKQKIVTGISVSGGSVAIPRKYKRKLRLELFHVFEHGIESHMGKLKIKNPNYLDSLVGKVNFWLQVEPKNKYANDYKERLINYKENLRFK